MAPFGAVVTAMITPFTHDGEVDFDRVHRLAKHLIANGTDGILVAGTTGESPTLTHTEKLALFVAVKEAVGGKAAVIAGTGTNSTKASVEMTREVNDIGVDGVMAVVPYYNKPSQRGLVAHFRAIADASDAPVLLYNVPARTSRLMEADTLADLATHPKIVAVKDAVDDIDFTMASREVLPEDFAIYSGSDDMTYPIMAVGGVGVVSVASHLIGKQIAQMVKAAGEGDLEHARELHYQLLPVFDGCFVEPNPQPLIGAMQELWEPIGDPRLPMVAPLPETTAALVAAVGKVQSL